VRSTHTKSSQFFGDYKLFDYNVLFSSGNVFIYAMLCYESIFVMRFLENSLQRERKKTEQPIFLIIFCTKTQIFGKKIT